jgi:hypothetical protein
VFGAQQSAPGGRIVRTIGMMRARAKIGLQNLAYNIRRLVTLENGRMMSLTLVPDAGAEVRRPCAHAQLRSGL